MKWVSSRFIVLVFAIFTKTVHSAAIEPSPTETTHHNHDDLDHEPPLHENHVDLQSGEVLQIIKGHGEDCVEESQKCNEKDGLVCSKDLGKCECDAGFIFSSTLGKCRYNEEHISHELLDDPRNELNDVSVDPITSTAPSEQEKDVHDEEHEDDNENHHDSVTLPINKCENKNCAEELGKYSKCDENTGDCICHDTENLDRSLTLLNGKCWIDRKINDSCTEHEECSATIKGKAWCHTDLETHRQFCQCEMFSYFDETLQECLEFAENGLFSPCKTDFQCTGLNNFVTGHGLGPNARCSKEKGVCECNLGPNDQKGFLYENFCFYKLQIGDPCVIDKECEMSFPEGTRAFCSPESKTCQRVENPVEGGEVAGIVEGRRIDGTSKFDEDNEDDDKDGGVLNSLKSAMGINVPNFVFIMIIAAVVILIVVIIAVFVVRKRHKYTMVRTRESGN